MSTLLGCAEADAARRAMIEKLLRGATGVSTLSKSRCDEAISRPFAKVGL